MAAAPGRQIKGQNQNPSDLPVAAVAAAPETLVEVAAPQVHLAISMAAAAELALTLQGLVAGVVLPGIGVVLPEAVEAAAALDLSGRAAMQGLSAAMAARIPERAAGAPLAPAHQVSQTFLG